MPSNKKPSAMLKQNDELTNYIHNNCPRLAQEVIQIYDQLNDFKLLRFGEYVGNIQHSYIIFSEYLIALLKVDRGKW